MLNILQNMYTLVLFMDILAMHHNTVEINWLMFFKRVSTMKVMLGPMSHLRWGPMSLSDRWLIGLHQLLNEYGIHYNDSVVINVGV